jgi:pSer/pThr/pTyr-binding forkhead associated (FHA) protein
MTKSLELTIRGGPDSGRTASFTRFPVVIGRQPDCDLAVLDPSVSRRHAQIGLAGDDFFVADIGSSYGTFVDGEKVLQDAVLHDGATIRIGDSEIVVSFPKEDEDEVLESTVSFTPDAPVDEVVPVESSDLEFLVHPPNGTSHTLVFREESAVFGRLADCDVPIDDPQMSKRHFRVRRLPHQFVVEDLQSRNGTYVDDERRDYWELLPGTRITAGQTRFVVRYVPREAPPPRDDVVHDLRTIQKPSGRKLYRAFEREGRAVWYESVGPQPPVADLLSELAKYLPMSLVLDSQVLDSLKAPLPPAAAPLCDWFDPSVMRKISPMFSPGSAAQTNLAIARELEDSDGWIAYFSELPDEDLLGRLRDVVRGAGSSPDGLDESAAAPTVLAKPSLFGEFAAHGPSGFCEQILAAAKGVVMESKEPGGWQALSVASLRKRLEHIGFKAFGPQTGEYAVPPAGG